MVIVNGKYTRIPRFMSLLRPLRGEEGEILYSEADPSEPLLPEVDEPR